MLERFISLFLSTQHKSQPWSSLKSLLRFHALILISGNSQNPFLASKLISHYASLQRPEYSTRVFFSSRIKDLFLWNSIIKTHFSNGDPTQTLEFFRQMRVSGFAPNAFTLPMAIVACADLDWLRFGRDIHGLASKLGIFSFESAIGSSFVFMYCKCGEIGDARKVFDEITVRDVYSWTSLIVGYVQNGESEKGLGCFFEMCRSEERPNTRTFVGGFQACGNLGLSVQGRSLHCLALKIGTLCSEEVKSSILSMYSKCNEPFDAYAIFCETAKKDVLSWMSIIGVHSRSGLMRQCVSLYREMEISGVLPDEMVTSCVIWGFGNSMDISSGKAFHGLLITRRCFDFNFRDEIVNNALTSMYCKFGLIGLAEKIFGSKSRWTKECFTTMMLGYSKIGDFVKCVELFREMQYRGIKASSDIMVSAISLCSQLGAKNLGRSLHCYLIKNLFDDENTSLANSLVEMYCKNGDLSIARRLFSIAKRETLAWNTMIACYVQRERFSEAIDLFDKIMLEKNRTPNQATFVIVLSACSHTSSLENGQKIHRLIDKIGLEINLSLATALIDMYAKCGELEKSRDLFDKANEKDIVLWNVMISGYAKHGKANSALELFHKMENNSDTKPNKLTFLALLSACSHSGLVEQGKHLLSKMKDYSLRPNLKIYTCMVDLLGRSGNLKEAEDLITSMPFEPDGGVWGSLLSACIKFGEHETGIRIARRAIESDPKNDGYYVTLSNMYCSIGKWEEAKKARRIMKERGVDKEPGRSLI